MGAETKIEWCHRTFNPWWGCTKVSPGCAKCYAETFAKRVGQSVWGENAPRRFFGEKHWREPEAWDRAAAKAGERHRVFCASMADVFEDRRDLDDHRVRLFDLIRRTPHLDWLLLTKRPEDVVALLERAMACMGVDVDTRNMLSLWWQDGEPPTNVWLGTTVEDQRAADERIPLLLETPAAVRFLSVEPLLGPVDLDLAERNHKAGETISWVIVGGESGPGARPCDVSWIRSVVEQCRAAGTPCFVKQLGAQPYSAYDVINGGVKRGEQRSPFALRDRKGGDPSEWPEDLRVREFPEVRHA